MGRCAGLVPGVRSIVLSLEVCAGPSGPGANIGGERNFESIPHTVSSSFRNTFGLPIEAQKLPESFLPVCL